MSAPTSAQAQALAQADALAQSTSTAVPAVPVAPKPVTPAEAIAAEPAKALDPIAEPSMFDKAKDMAAPYLAKVEPYVEKAQVVAGEYAEKAANKTEEFINKVEARIEGATTPTSTQAGVPTSKSLADDPEILHPNAGIAGTPSTSTSATEGSINTAPSTVGEAGEKAKVLFEQGISVVQSTFDKLTHTIDEKTASPTHPGIITQVTNAVHKGVEKVEGYLNETGTTGTTTTTTTATTTTTTEHPVQTTTNTLPHAAVTPTPLL